MSSLDKLFRSKDFNATDFVKRMYNGTVPTMETLSNEKEKESKNYDNNTKQTISSLPVRAVRAVVKGFGLNSKNESPNKGNSNNLQTRLNQPSEADVIALEDKFEKTLKREIADKYHVFITAAEDTRELTDLIRRQNEQLELYEKTLNLLKSGERNDSLKKHSHSINIIKTDNGDDNDDVHRFSSSSSSSDDDDGTKEDFRSFYIVSPYAQLDVLILQRRMAEATVEANRLIRNFIENGQIQNKNAIKSSSIGLDSRLSKLNDLVINALQHTPLKDHKRQFTLIKMTSTLLRSISGSKHLLYLRKKYIQRRLSCIVVETTTTVTDHIGTKYVSDVIQTFMNVINITSLHLHSAFANDTSDWPTILCMFVAWVKRDCIDSIIRILNYGTFNSLVGKHQIHTPYMYSYPLYHAMQQQQQEQQQQQQQERQQERRQKDRPREFRKGDEDEEDYMNRILMNGCQYATYFNVRRFNILLIHINTIINQCKGINIGIPISACLQRKLIHQFAIPSLHEHCKAFHHYIQISSGCSRLKIDSNDNNDSSNYEIEETKGRTDDHNNDDASKKSTKRTTTKISLTSVLVATTTSLRNGIVLFIDALDGEENQKEEKKERNGNKKYKTKKSNILTKLVINYMCNTCQWFFAMMYAKLKDGDDKLNKPLLLTTLEKYVLNDIIVELNDLLKNESTNIHANEAASEAYDSFYIVFQKCLKTLYDDVPESDRINDSVNNDNYKTESEWL